MATQSFHVLQMGKHFLYLPLYFAERHDFFGLLPRDCKVVIDHPIAEHTDAATYQQMIDASPDYQDFVMAITDPMQVFQTPVTEQRRPAVLATLVTNAAFWAIDHGTHKIRTFRDLRAFDKIIAYGKGTTSYDIAARIVRSCSPQRSLEAMIRIVEPGKELLLLSQLRADENTVALSPDILQIEEMASRGSASVELALGETLEYNDVLVAALVSSNEFVAKHPAVVRGILAAIQRSLQSVHRRDPDVLAFARDYFHFADRAEGAIAKAIQSGVVPSSIKVERAHWMNAAKAHHEARKAGRRWSSDNEATAADYFDTCISPYADLRAEAIRLADEPPGATHKSPFTHGVALAMVMSAIVVAAASIASRTSGLASAAIAVILWSGVYATRDRKRLMHAVYWLSFLGGVALIAVIAVPAMRTEKVNLLSIGLAFFLPATFELVKLYGTDRNGGDGH